MNTVSPFRPLSLSLSPLRHSLILTMCVRVDR